MVPDGAVGPLFGSETDFLRGLSYRDYRPGLDPRNAPCWPVHWDFVASGSLHLSGDHTDEEEGFPHTAIGDINVTSEETGFVFAYAGADGGGIEIVYHPPDPPRWAYLGTGSLTTSGDSVLTAGYDCLGGGVWRLSGSSTVSGSISLDGSSGGRLFVSGYSDIRGNTTYVSSGGLTLTGIADEQTGAVVMASGGLVISGVADASSAGGSSSPGTTCSGATSISTGTTYGSTVVSGTNDWWKYVSLAAGTYTVVFHAGGSFSCGLSGLTGTCGSQTTQFSGPDVTYPKSYTHGGGTLYIQITSVSGSIPYTFSVT